MSRRVLDVAIRSEFRKGFGDIARQFASLEKSLQKVDGLTRSLNKVAENLDRTLAFKQAQYGAKKVAENQTKANKTLNEGVAIAKRYENAHTSLGKQLVAVSNAQKAGSISSKQRLEAEIGLLTQYIKKTKDLSVLQNKNGYRNGKGHFVSFSPAAISDVRKSFEAATKVVEQEISRATPKIINKIKDQNGRIKEAVKNIYSQGLGYRSEFTNRTSQNSFYQSAWGPRRAGLGNDGIFSSQKTANVIAQTTGMAGNPQLKALGDDYRALEREAGRVSSRIRRMNFGPNSANADAGFKKLFDSYNRLGHFLFQLQYSTMTIFGLSGIGMILSQADAYITLRNQVARTSDSIDDLGANMKDVFRISRETFSDPKTVGKIFSTLNKYSEDLKLSRQEVGNVTQGIAGAFAASPGNAQEKAASQYQFMQAIQSNRLGGDELRSVMEMAPYVQDILAKGVGKLRGMSGPADLRALAGKPGEAVTTKEIVSIFNDPAIQAEIRDTLGRSARTFGDLLMVGKVRLMEMTEQFSQSSGIFTQIIQMLGSFIGSDEKFAKFTQALEAATLALVVYGTMLGGQAAKTGASRVIGGIGSRLGFGRNTMGITETILEGGRATATRGVGPNGHTLWGQTMGNGAFNTMYATAQRENRMFNRGARVVNGAMVGARPGLGATVAKGAETAFVALGSALNSLKTPATTAAKVVDGVKTSYSRATTALTVANRGMTAGMTAVAARGMIGTRVFAGLGGIMNTIWGFVSRLAVGFTGFSIPLIVIAGIIAALVMRFNKLLGAMTGGMNIMDILRGTWNMLMDQLGKVGKFLANSFLGDIWNAITGFIDGILKFFGRAAGRVGAYQDAQSDRQFGGNDSRLALRDSDGKIYQATQYRDVDTGKWHQRWRTDENGRRIAATSADGTFGQTVQYYRPDLPSGNKSELPNQVATGNSGGNQGRKDPWPEYLRDLRLRIQNVSDLRDVLPQMQDIQGQINENIRRAMDVMDFDSSGFATLAEAWTAFGSTYSAKANQVNQLNATLKSERLIEAMREFGDALDDLYIEFNANRIKAGMSSREAAQYDARASLVNTFLENPQLQGGMETRNSIRSALAAGRLDNAENLLKSNLGAGANADYEQARADQLDNMDGEIAARMRRQNSLAVQGLENQARVLGLYGQQRDIQTEINGLIESFVEEHGETALQSAELNAQLERQIQLVRQRNALQQAYNADWRNGFGDAIAEYQDGLNNIAASTKEIFGNALKGVEDGLVQMMTATDLKMSDIREGLSNIFKSIQADIARLFVRQVIMKPITNWIEKMGEQLWGGGLKDQTIQANNVYVNGQMMGGGADMMSNIGNIFSGGKGASGGNWFTNALKVGANFLPPPFNFLASLFHEGGTAGNANVARMVSSSLFTNAKRYHTGTLNAGLPALGVNEVPAILKQGEKVLTAAQYSAMNSSNNSTTFAPNISVAYTSNGGTGKDSGGEGNEAHAKAVAAMVRGAVNEAILEYDQKSRRPGSPAYLQNKRK